jgi:hypothetical protein
MKQRDGDNAHNPDDGDDEEELDEGKTTRVHGRNLTSVFRLSARLFMVSVHP